MSQSNSAAVSPGTGRGFSSRTVWMLLATVLGALITLWLVWEPARHPTAPSAAVEPRTEASSQPVVRLVPPGRVYVEPQSELAKKLEVVTVSAESVTFPILTVTGFVIARWVSGQQAPEDRWNFSSPQLLANYVDWLKARSEVAFNEQQVEKVRQLSEASVAGHEKVVARLRKLVESGTDAPKDLAAAETELLHAQLQGQKEIFAAEQALKVAQATRTSLERQLFQEGLDPDYLATATEGEVAVVADVPESKVALVREGVACEARFYGFPDQLFPGTVGRLSPSLSTERRTLRVPFELTDPQERLKPGMFAEIGLGTEQRRAILVPAEAALHVGLADFVFLAEDEPGTYRVAEVTVGEPHGGKLEILAGVSEGIRLIGANAILLKPMVVQLLEQR